MTEGRGQSTRMVQRNLLLERLQITKSLSETHVTGAYIHIHFHTLSHHMLQLNLNT